MNGPREGTMVKSTVQTLEEYIAKLQATAAFQDASFQRRQKSFIDNGIKILKMTKEDYLATMKAIDTSVAEQEVITFDTYNDTTDGPLTAERRLMAAITFRDALAQEQESSKKRSGSGQSATKKAVSY